MSPAAAQAGRELEASAPAKINLGLRIVARRPDGYHELESVFAPLDLADPLSLRIEPSSSPSVTLVLEPDGAGVPTGAENLALRAAEAFLAASGLSLALTIGLTKQIPVGAGLGGGSSDAGSVLRLLAGAFPEALPGPALSALALSLGADVPYFLDPRPARVSGIGECVEPFPGLPRLDLLLVNPGVVLPTAEVYRAFDALVPRPGPRPGPPAHPLRLPGGPLLTLDNDLEPAALRLCPELRRLRERLQNTGPLAVGLSGSGPTLFGVFPGKDAAEAASRRDLGAGIWTRVAVTAESG